MKYTFTCLILCVCFSSYGQPIDEFGKKIFDRFLSGQKLDSSFLPSETFIATINSEILDGIDSAVKSGEATWESSSGYIFGKQVKNRADCIKALHEMVTWQLQTDWNNLLHSIKQCGVLVKERRPLGIKKESTDQYSNAVSYWIMFAQSKYAILVEATPFNGKNYLSRVDSRLHLPDEKGGYSCFIFCEEGQNPIQICDIPLK